MKSGEIELPSITSPTGLHADFPTANDLPVPLSEDPDPKVDIRVRETWEDAGQAGCPQNSGPHVPTEQLDTHDIVRICMIGEFENGTRGRRSHE